MTRKMLILVLVLMVCLVPPSAMQAGGWVVVTLKELPRAVRAGEPVAFTFIVRQHGQRAIHLDGAQLVATQPGSGETIRFEAEPVEPEGHHRVVATFPEAGAWEWYFEPSPFPPNGDFAPLTVLPAETAIGSTNARLQEQTRLVWLAGWLARLFEPQTTVQATAHDGGLSAAEYGRALFLAKGCASCHLHEDAHFAVNVQAGPNLSDYDPNPEFVRVWLQDSWNLTAGEQWRMPTMELSDEEISALIAFLAQD